LDYAKKSGVTLNIGSLSELKYFANTHSGSDIIIRINPGFGDGEFKQVVTGGEDSKFGILHTQIDFALEIIKKHELQLIGIHCHLGSGLYNTTNFAPMVEYMFALASNIVGIKVIDLGGGFGVRYRESDKNIDLTQFAKVIDKYHKKYPSIKDNKVKIIFEPGKYLVAESTFLLSTVTNIREQGELKIVGLDTGLNQIIRPALYSSYHHIINLSKPSSAKETVQVVGNICESTDVLNKKIEIAQPEEGDILAILTAGAYCSSMSSLYNLRPYASEVLLHDDTFSVIRKRLSFEEAISSLGFIGI
jgi:diaminopimelate decarboxylase